MKDFYKYTFMIPMQAIATLPSVLIHSYVPEQIIL